MRTFYSITTASALAISLVASGETARADSSVPVPTGGSGSTNPDLNTKQETRSGVVIGATGLFATGTAAGYPNQASEIGDPAFYGAGGAMAGGGVNAFVMGALADVFNFGLWFGYTLIANNDWSSEGLGGGFRLEAFPFYSLVPAIKNLGFFAQFGIGSANLEAQRGFYPGSDGVQTYASAGAFYEFTLFRMKHGHFTLAPSIEYDYVGARSIDRSTLGLGLRVAFYTGP